MLLSFSAALAAEPAPNLRTTVLPIYALPAGAAADGKLAEWAGVPPVPAERFNIGPFPDRTKRPAPDDFAPTLRCGMRPGSSDLYFLIVVRDSQRYTEARLAWIEGDRVEMFLDFGRQARDEQQPDWWKDKDRNRFVTPPGMGQFGLGPQTLAFAAEARVGSGAAKWRYGYASVPVEGGTAYELHLHGQSVLDSLGAKTLPERAGFELILDDQDNPLVLRTEGWSNGGFQGCDSAWLFIRELRMAHVFTDQYGILSLRPQPADAAAAAPLPKTLTELFGPDPTAAQIEQSIATLPTERLADLVYWAGICGVQFTPALTKSLMQVGAPLVRENCLAVLYYTEQPKEAAQTACESAFATDAAPQSPNVAVLADLVNDKYALGLAKAAAEEASASTAEAAGQEPPRELTNSIGMKLVLIPPGEFMMGSPEGEKVGRYYDEGAQHRVKITRGFYLGATEVTQAQWQKVMGNNPSKFKGDNLPVDMLTWHDAMEFCRKLSAMEGKQYRLPTEAEWEYACRAGSTGPYAGNGQLGDMGNYWKVSGKRTHPVGGRQANAWGLYDMHGNVWEWCQSQYKAYPYREGDGRESLVDKTMKRVLRGGSWTSLISECRASDRNGSLPDWGPSEGAGGFGFRCAMTLE
jgi:formylglycine-generating enzyme required for sulfatase activity